MTDEKKKPEEDEVTEEQLDGVAGGATVNATHQEITVAKPLDKASPLLMDTVVGDNSLGTAEIDFVRTTDDDED